MYVAPRTITTKYGLSRTTLAKWSKAGKIRSIRTGDYDLAPHRYYLPDILNQLGISATDEHRTPRFTILYARVSSHKQEEAGDLQRQIDSLKAAVPTHDRIISDIASSINFQRKGLTTLLDLVEADRVGTVVVTYPDRLARFGQDLLKRIFTKHGCSLHVVYHDRDPSHEDGGTDLAQDLLAVCNFFVAKNNGRRSATMRKDRHKRQAYPTDEGSSKEANKAVGKAGEDTEDTTTPP